MAVETALSEIGVGWRMLRLKCSSFNPEKMMVPVKPCALLTVLEDCYFPVVLTLVFTFAFVLMGMKTPIMGLCLSVYFSYSNNYFYYWWEAP